MKAWFKKMKKIENVIPFLFSVILAIFVFLDTNFFDGKLLLASWIFILLSLVVLVSGIYFAAGFIVMKALFKVGAGLTLLIFLAQTFCEVPHSVESESALAGLLVVGFLYITYDFLNNLFTICKNLYKKVENDNSKEKWFITILFISFVGLFSWSIYQVINPVVGSLCI